MPSHLTVLRSPARIALGMASLAWTPLSLAQTALEPEQGGIDFSIQGEYSGKPGTATPLAAQVIALGSGQFQAIFFTGGLPGRGWNGTDTMAAERECGAFFEYFRPLLNMAFPPLSWQTFDIYFTAARYDAAGKIQIEPSYATVLWNGATVQDKRPLANSTLLGDPQGPTAGPLRFQSHGDPVYYRNIWVIDGVSAVKRGSGMRSVPSVRDGYSVGGAHLDGRAIPASDRESDPDRTAFGWYFVPDGSGNRNMRMWGK